MTSVNISIKKEAYDFLKSVKTKDKSFSDVILGFKKKGVDSLQFFGVLKHVNRSEREKSMKKFRESFNSRLK